MPKDSPQPDVSADAASDPRGLALANCIRALSIDAVEGAKSGHPGAPMGMADAAVALFRDHLKFDASASNWPDRDRVVLSTGHALMLLYALLHLTRLPAVDSLFSADAPGRTVGCRVRACTMSAATNGTNTHGGLIPCGGTFPVFSDYARSAIRLSAPRLAVDAAEELPGQADHIRVLRRPEMAARY